MDLYFWLDLGQHWAVPDGVNGNLRVDVSLDLGDIHVRGVLEVGGESVVLADEGIEDVGEVDVGVLITGIDTAVLWSHTVQLMDPVLIWCNVRI